jgi:hypothetical protein
MPKRTRSELQDINQFAASIVRQSTEQPGPVDLTDQAAISRVMRATGAAAGSRARPRSTPG